MKEQLDNIKEDVTEIKVDIAEIKIDLKHHIKRTDQVEEMLLPIYKFKVWLTYTVVLVGLVSTILTIRSFL